MKIFVDETEAPAGGATLGAALDAARRVADEQGRIIVEVWADGERIPDHDLADPPTFEPYADEIRMVTAAPEALVVTTLLDAADALEEVKAIQAGAARKMQTGDTPEAMGAFGEALAVWEAVRRSVSEGCSLIGRSPGELLGAGGAGTLAEASKALAADLTTLRDYAQAEDWSSAADILEFDLSERADAWQDILRRLAAAVRSEEATA
ncbi:MAG: hypothetical protein ACF8QF_12405 [Phycisphaerales bacterium]